MTSKGDSLMKAYHDFDYKRENLQKACDNYNYAQMDRLVMPGQLVPIRKRDWKAGVHLGMTGSGNWISEEHKEK